MFSGISFVGLIILFFILPETKDRSLEEVEELFMSKEYKKKLQAQSELEPQGALIAHLSTMSTSVIS